VLSTGNFRGLASNGTIFVAVGSFGQNATSPDGIAWTDHAAIGAGNQYNSVVWNADSAIFCTVPNFEAFFPNPGRAAVSADGINWTNGPILPQALQFGAAGMSWNGSVFVAVGNGQPAGALTSPNGLTWTVRPSLNSFEWTFLFWTGSVFVTGTAGGGIQLATSADNGVTWITQACPFVPSAGASPLIGES
jgi:hypothetical protein